MVIALVGHDIHVTVLFYSGCARVPAQAHGTYRSCRPLPWPSRGCRLGSSFPQLAAACLSPRTLPLQHRQLAADRRGGGGVSTRSRAPAGAPRLAPAAAAEGGSAKGPRAVPLSPAAEDGHCRRGSAARVCRDLPLELVLQICLLIPLPPALAADLPQNARHHLPQGPLRPWGKASATARTKSLWPFSTDLLPLPSPGPAHTQSHLRQEDF